jgi:hypothetical protein
MFNKVNVDDAAYKMTSRLRTAATNGPLVHPPDDIWAWRTTVELCRQRTSDSSTRTLWKSYQQIHLIASRRNGRREWWIWPCEVFLFTFASGLPSFRRKVCCIFLSPLRIHRLGWFWTRDGSDGKHGNHYGSEAMWNCFKFYGYIVSVWGKRGKESRTNLRGPATSQTHERKLHAIREGFELGTSVLYEYCCYSCHHTS